jgi:hypothetical protein
LAVSEKIPAPGAIRGNRYDGNTRCLWLAGLGLLVEAPLLQEPPVARGYRWIIGSLNDDRPYDWMVGQMLAGDERDPTDAANVVATGFVVRNFFRWNYNSWLKDSVEHTAKAFLGLTVNCAHCHDHKYDPIKQTDYFALRACFEPIEIRHDRVPGEPDPGPYPQYA